MEVVEANAKFYEKISYELDPMYREWIEGVEMVREYIEEKGLIIYGGTAIDYALRLHGDCIYPDGSVAIPDLDAFSPDSVADAYELANRLFKVGFNDARAITASYVRAMRVDIGGMHWVADLSYVSPTIFDRLPYLVYNGVKIVHPNYQRIDFHSALAFPFDDPPKEVIFNRIRKDVARFAKLDKYYPINTSPYSIAANPLVNVKVPIDFRKHVFHGFAAYALWCEVIGDRLPAQCPRLRFTRTADGFTFTSPVNRIDMLTFNIYDNSATKPVYRTNIVGAVAKTASFSLDDTHVVYHSSKHRLITVGSADIGKNGLRMVDANASNTRDNTVKDVSVNGAGRGVGDGAGEGVNDTTVVKVDTKQTNSVHIRFAGVQYLLYYFMSMAYFGDMVYGVTGGKAKQTNSLQASAQPSSSQPSSGNFASQPEDSRNPAPDNIYLQFYKYTLAMTNIEGDVIPGVNCPDIHIYGNENLSERASRQIKEILHAVGDPVVVPGLPKNYTPNKGAPPQTFDYESSTIFHKDGRVTHSHD